MENKENNLELGVYELNFNSKEAPVEIKEFFMNIISSSDEGITLTHDVYGKYNVYLLRKKRFNSLIHRLKKFYGYDSAYYIAALLVSIDGDTPIFIADDCLDKFNNYSNLWVYINVFYGRCIGLEYLARKMTHSNGKLLLLDVNISELKDLLNSYDEFIEIYQMADIAYHIDIYDEFLGIVELHKKYDMLDSADWGFAYRVFEKKYDLIDVPSGSYGENQITVFKQRHGIV